MADPYLGVLFLVAVAALICTVMVTGSWLLGPKKVTPYKQSAYECGVAPLGTARERFPIKFYLVAIVFILFDIEVVFLWGFISMFRHAELEFQVFAFGAFLIYMFLWVLTDVYALRIGAIDWDESTSLDAGKLGEDPVEPVNQPTPVLPLGAQPVGGGQ